jgi:hypothetical protein
VTAPLGSEAEAELAIERLFDKLENWLIQQPETLVIWAQPRNTRKRAGKVIADAMTTIPKRAFDSKGMSRRMRRDVLKQLREQDQREWWKDISV